MFGRLDVAVDQAGRVRLGERAARLAQQVHDAARHDRAVELDQLAEVDAAQQLHRVVEDAVGRAAVVVDRDRARVRQARGQLHLALEARERALALGPGREQLDRRRPAQQRVARLPHDAHRAVAEARGQIGTDRLSRPGGAGARPCAATSA